MLAETVLYDDEMMAKADFVEPVATMVLPVTWLKLEEVFMRSPVPVALVSMM